VSNENAVSGNGMTQFGRALSELNIEILCANTSQAKGRVERAHHTLQDRLVKELRLAGISTIEAANAFLPGFVANYNGRFCQTPGSRQRPSPFTRSQAGSRPNPVLARAASGVTPTGGEL
jgi:hypothetical protein